MPGYARIGVVEKYHGKIDEGDENEIKNVGVVGGCMHACTHGRWVSVPPGAYRYKIAQHHLCLVTSMQREEKVRNAMPI